MPLIEASFWPAQLPNCLTVMESRKLCREHWCGRNISLRGVQTLQTPSSSFALCSSWMETVRMAIHHVLSRTLGVDLSCSLSAQLDVYPAVDEPINQTNRDKKAEAFAKPPSFRWPLCIGEALSTKPGERNSSCCRMVKCWISLLLASLHPDRHLWRIKKKMISWIWNNQGVSFSVSAPGTNVPMSICYGLVITTSLSHLKPWRWAETPCKLRGGPKTMHQWMVQKRWFQKRNMQKGLVGQVPQLSSNETHD